MSRPSFALTVLLASLAGSLLMAGTARSQIGLYTWELAASHARASAAGELYAYEEDLQGHPEQQPDPVTQPSEELDDFQCPYMQEAYNQQEAYHQHCPYDYNATYHVDSPAQYCPYSGRCFVHEYTWQDSDTTAEAGEDAAAADENAAEQADAASDQEIIAEPAIAQVPSTDDLMSHYDAVYDEAVYGATPAVEVAAQTDTGSQTANDYDYESYNYDPYAYESEYDYEADYGYEFDEYQTESSAGNDAPAATEQPIVDQPAQDATADGATDEAATETESYDPYAYDYEYDYGYDYNYDYDGYQTESSAGNDAPAATEEPIVDQPAQDATADGATDEAATQAESYDPYAYDYEYDYEADYGYETDGMDAATDDSTAGEPAGQAEIVPAAEASSDEGTSGGESEYRYSDEYEYSDDYGYEYEYGDEYSHGSADDRDPYRLADELFEPAADEQPATTEQPASSDVTGEEPGVEAAEVEDAGLSPAEAYEQWYGDYGYADGYDDYGYEPHDPANASAPSLDLAEFFRAARQAVVTVVEQVERIVWDMQYEMDLLLCETGLERAWYDALHGQTAVEAEVIESGSIETGSAATETEETVEPPVDQCRQAEEAYPWYECECWYND